MALQNDQDRPTAGPMSLAISNLIVGMLREYTGRGPTKARTTIRDNVVVVVLEQTLTKGEQSLVARGRSNTVLEIRHEFQNAMRDECSEKVEELTGRKVVAFLSANHIDPDVGVEIFLLDGAPSNGDYVAAGLN
ncbi:MAG: hypothetical protein QOJ25_1598 [Solirubrobacteraceae bacterium]|jgi:uncharacterized protein YbcI|nr:hypothetical protein [Solirubrobacteraceae bacterium]